MQPVKSRDNLQKSADSPGSSSALGELSPSSSRDEQQDSYSRIPKKQRKKAVELKRGEVLSQCLNVSKEPEKEEKKSSFALYVAEKLEMFSPRNRAIAEKKITDVLFAAEMDMLEPMAVSEHTAPQHAYIPGHNSQQTFMSMLQ